MADSNKVEGDRGRERERSGCRGPVAEIFIASDLEPSGSWSAGVYCVRARSRLGQGTVGAVWLMGGEGPPVLLLRASTGWLRSVGRGRLTLLACFREWSDSRGVEMLPGHSLRWTEVDEGVIIDVEQQTPDCTLQEGTSSQQDTQQDRPRLRPPASA